MGDIGTLKLTIHGGIRLKAMDTNGLSDPYVKVTMSGQEERTLTVRNNLNPVWDHDSLMVVYSMDDFIQFSVFDEDSFSTDDLIGECTYTLSQVEQNKMQWLTLPLEDSRSSGIIKSGSLKVMMVLHLY